MTSLPQRRAAAGGGTTQWRLGAIGLARQSRKKKQQPTPLHHGRMAGLMPRLCTLTLLLLAVTAEASAGEYWRGAKAAKSEDPA